MKIFHVVRTDNPQGNDNILEFIAIAKDYEHAMSMFPVGPEEEIPLWSSEDQAFTVKRYNELTGEPHRKEFKNCVWVRNINDVKTNYLGEACEEFDKPKVILYSDNFF